MTAAVFGLAGTVVASLAALIGVLLTGRAPTHLADVQGMQVLLDETRADRDDLRERLRACQADGRAKDSELAILRAQVGGGHA